MDIKLALIDMDGTVYSGDAPVDGVNEALDFLKRRGVETFFLTNYAGRKRDKYSQKLEEMGIDASSEDVVTSGWLTAKYISRNHPDTEVFVLGEEGLKEELRDSGVHVAESCERPDVLVVSNKHDLTYGDLKEVLQNIRDETVLLGTNPDETIPGDEGEIPGAGTIIGAVEAMTGREIKIIGKPSKNAVETVTGMHSVSPESCLMVGDRLNTDILMGEENGMETVLVLTGVTDREDLESSNIEPEHVLDSIADMKQVF
jgi:HAD superfamily hydrolase (TIGR01457 family)